MSAPNPGLYFDASSSWNGFNHQGKLAIFFAIKEILGLYDHTKNHDANKQLLDKYFIEIEYIEDFSIGKYAQPQDQYLYIHQVKDHESSSLSKYDSAFLGLAINVLNHKDTIKNAYLHTTTDIRFNGVSVADRVKKLISCPQYLNNILKDIDKARKDSKYKASLYQKKQGRNKDFIQKLKSTLPASEQLSELNIDDALDNLETTTKDDISRCQTMDTKLVEKIDVYSYMKPSGNTEKYCGVNEIKGMLKNMIEHGFTSLISEMKPYWKEEQYVNRRYLLLLGKLDDYIIKRDLNNKLNSASDSNRRIPLGEIYEWLVSSEIEMGIEHFYRYIARDTILSAAGEFCEMCDHGKYTCESCNIVSARNKIGMMKTNEFDSFMEYTSPENCEGINEKILTKYFCEDRVAGILLCGIRDVSKRFEDEEYAIVYIDLNRKKCLLTTIATNPLTDAKKICTNIMNNRRINDLQREYDYFISKDVNCDSIFMGSGDIRNSLEEEISQDDKYYEHIARIKKVGIVSLDKFMKNI